MYQALYRKWRPRVFEDVSGQPYITGTLKNELIAGRVAHAYLFTGSRGTGKTTCAKILAKAVNCLHPHDGDPCNECEICRGIDQNSIPDVVEIDAASNNGVDNIRDLRDETVFSPAAAKYRVYIIDEAHMLSGGAFNALLKTLEEPPAYVVFILATTEVHKIPATILSRCQRFDFRRIPPEDIAARLLYVAGEENLSLTEEAAALIARLSDGALRDALSLLDRCAGQKDGPIDETSVEQAAGLAGREYLFELSRAAQAGDYSAALAVIDRLYSEAKDQERLCEELMSHYRSLMLIKTASGAQSILSCPQQQFDRLKSCAEGYRIEELLHALTLLQGTLETMRRSSSRRVEMEMCLLRLCRPELDSSGAALLRRIAAIEEQLKAGTLPVRLVQTQPQRSTLPTEPHREEKRTVTAEEKIPLSEAPEPRSSEPPTPEIREPENRGEESAPANADEPLACWPEILECLAGLDAPLRGFLNDSSAALHGDIVLINCKNSMFAEMIRQQSHQKPLVEAVRRVTGQPYRVGVTKKSLEKSEKPRDPLDEILKNASDSGLGITER